MRRYHLHAYNVSSNIPTSSVVLGIVGLAINPLLGIAGMVMGEGIHNCITKEPPREIPFWAKPDSGINSFRSKGHVKK